MSLIPLFSVYKTKTYKTCGSVARVGSLATVHRAHTQAVIQEQQTSPSVSPIVDQPGVVRGSQKVKSG